MVLESRTFDHFVTFANTTKRRVGFEPTNPRDEKSQERISSKSRHRHRICVYKENAGNRTPIRRSEVSHAAFAPHSLIKYKKLPLGIEPKTSSV